MLKSLEIKLFHLVMLQPGTKEKNFTTLLAPTVHRKANAGQFCQGIALTKKLLWEKKLLNVLELTGWPVLSSIHWSWLISRQACLYLSYFQDVHIRIIY